jgi:hypothetical protein
MNHICPVALKEKNKADAKRDDKKIYRDKRWRKLREEVLEDQEHICLWSLYVEGIIRYANVGHHIVEIIVDESKAYIRENVIGVNKYSHDIIHNLYKSNKEETMSVLYECNKLWNSGVRMDGLGILKDILNFE